MRLSNDLFDGTCLHLEVMGRTEGLGVDVESMEL